MDADFRNEITELHEQINRFVEHLRRMNRVPSGFAALPWTPQVNIYETDSHFLLLVEVPGAEPDGVRVRLHGDVVTIEGERKPSPGMTSARCRHMEISFGPFYRSIRLPGSAKSEGIEAFYQHGFLQIRVPKMRPEERAREIPIESKD